DDYTGEEEVRIDLYRKFAAVRSFGELRDLQEEILDRFGPPPPEVERLVDLARLRIRASALGITSIVEREGEVYIRPVLGSRLSQALLRRDLGDGVHVTPNQVRLTLDRLRVDAWDAVLAVVRAVEEANATVLEAAG
ncbi:MAG: transcription-repair coupling factor, partial [Thermomicrobiaceae bacterium]|nr:transcription-repair coupling factor [Thermomicrobiaceae bacterium]